MTPRCGRGLVPHANHTTLIQVDGKRGVSSPSPLEDADPSPNRAGQPHPGADWPPSTPLRSFRYLTPTQGGHRVHDASEASQHCFTIMPPTTTNRPWYCRDDVVDEYRTTLTTGGENLPVLKALKLVRAIIVNVGILALTGYAISRGGNPSVLGFTGLLVLGAYNGLELTDYLALVQAYKEVQEAATDTSDDRNT